tara:strand:- start:6 stop:539 length:534 start_codon:yes stop_codon:yes gene_type:complete
MVEDTPDVPEESPTWNSYYANSFDYFTGDGNLDKAADGPLIDIIPTALKDIISEEVTDTISPSPIGIQWTIKTAVPVNGIEIDDSSLESLLEDNLTTESTEVSVDREASSDIDVDIQSTSYVVLSEGDEELQVAVPVITSEDESGTSTRHITRQTLAIIIAAGGILIFLFLCKVFKK